MTILYNIGIRIYYMLILIASTFNNKASLWIKGRHGVLGEIRQSLNANEKNAWFHVSSLGEFEQGRPIMEQFKKHYPEYKIILTFFSPSGYEIRKNYSAADFVCYLPLDTRRNARKFIEYVNPELVFFVKYDYWYHHLKAAQESGSRLFLVSGIFREKQAFFKSYGSWYRQILSWFEHLFVQDIESINLLKQIGIEHCSVAGDTRFDRVTEIAVNSEEIHAAENFASGFSTMVCGSTWPADEEILIDYIENHSNELKLILAPHEIHKSHIEAIEKKLHVPYALYSKSNETDLTEARVLIIDNIGMLSSIYKYGQLSYIGGGLGNGIHNTLEAAVYNIPVLFGPNYRKFREAVDLIKCGGAFAFNAASEFAPLLNNLLSDRGKLSVASQAAGAYVKERKGATKTILNYLKNN
jgi:3-deoxy-D-manno-octulosonic-acid transferase